MLINGANRIRCWVVLALIALIIAISGPRAERWGDNFQIALPLMALGCQAANGKAPEYLLRYAVLFTGIHGSKAALGDAPFNLRPTGRLGGMPSGHTATAAFGASTLLHECINENIWVKGAVVLAASFTGASRIDAHAHSIWQVLVGALWGLLCDRALRRNGKGRRMISRLIVPLRRRATLAFTALAIAITAALPGRAETVLTGYAGYQSAPHSGVTLNGDHFTAGWKGKPFAAPPYWGLRVTRWSGNLGWGAEFTHTKVYADDETLARSGVGHLEFSDGLNIATVNILHRWPRSGALTPYAGAGLGVAVPHVEVGEGAARTFEYQLTGPAVRLFLGASYALSDRWQAIAEYQMTYSQNKADLTSGGTLETDIVTNALNVGIGWRF